ncbi:DEAD/DEAH box helicase family protein, partial [Mycoplasma sp. CSL7475-4]|uniref:DEAD/DEAH box helicase family protein n=1 Tax=Mycoplasma sp. CSL7475-4 TaxID=2973942 RepID=UPI00216ADDBC
MAAINLSDVQARAVNELVEKCDLDNKSSVYFKAPTGSGKTFMIANVIDRLIKLHGHKQKLFFIIATLSSGELPKQMEQNLNEYKHVLYSIRNIERIESPSVNKTKNKDYEPQLVLEQNKVMIFGASTFGKGRILTEYNYLENFIQEIKSEGYKLIYIRDESHHGGEVKNNFVDIDRSDFKNKNQQNEKHFEALVQKAAQYIIKMTATPPRTQNQVVITEKELQTDSIKLIKTEAKRNDFKVDKFLEEISDFDLLQKACERFKEIKKAYDDAESEPALINIHPAMLIQVKDKTEKDVNFEQNMNKIIKILEQNNLTWVKYFSGDKAEQNGSSIKEEISLKKISKNNSGVDCIIFKVGPATGWNIPRACMLVQLRNVSSENLNIQTLGRIKRNPNPNYFVDNDDQLFEDSIANKYWFYSNFEEKKKEWSYYELQAKWKQDSNGLTSFYKGSINRNLLKKVSNTQAYNDALISVLSKKDILAECKELQQHFNEYGYLAPRAELLKNDKNEDFRKINDQDKITNSIELELYIENFLYTNKTYFIDTTK